MFRCSVCCSAFLTFRDVVVWLYPCQLRVGAAPEPVWCPLQLPALRGHRVPFATATLHFPIPQPRCGRRYVEGMVLHTCALCRALCAVQGLRSIWVLCCRSYRLMGTWCRALLQEMQNNGYLQAERPITPSLTSWDSKARYNLHKQVCVHGRLRHYAMCEVDGICV
jgi:hypothetical protein